MDLAHQAPLSMWFPRQESWHGLLFSSPYMCISSVQLLSRVWLFATPWTAVCQASLSITTSWSLLRLTSIELVILSNHLILCCPYISLQITRIIFCTNFREKEKNNLSLAWPEEVYMHSNKENSAQLIRGPEKPHWAGVCGPWWENNEKGLKLEGRHRMCSCVVSLLHTFLDLWQWFFFKYYDFPQLLSSILCLICF